MDIEGNAMSIEPLMTAEDVGKYLQVGARYVTEKYLLMAGFPKPIRLPTPEGGRGHPKWKFEDIERWVEKYRGVDWQRNFACPPRHSYHAR